MAGTRAAEIDRLLHLTEKQIYACEARNLATVVHGVAKSRVRSACTADAAGTRTYCRRGEIDSRFDA